MRKVLKFSFCIFLIASSCKKSLNDAAENNLNASINGMQTKFMVKNASLVRSVLVDEKRIDIGAVSEDGKYILVLSIIEDMAAGNAITAADYTVRLFNADDTLTGIDESINTKAFVSLGVYTGNELQTDNYIENGTINITESNEKKLFISGNFDMVLTSRSGGADYTITNGSFDNVKYSVIN